LNLYYTLKRTYMKKRLFLPIALCSALLSFSSCQDNEKTRIETVKNDTMTRTRIVRTESKDTDLGDRLKEESRDIKAKLERLREKGKKKGGKVEKDVDRKIDEWDSERKNFSFDKTNEDIKDGWKEFKAKVEASVDSLDKKM
jgi:hypothetical protein